MQQKGGGTRRRVRVIVKKHITASSTVHNIYYKQNGNIRAYHTTLYLTKVSLYFNRVIIRLTQLGGKITA